VRRTVLVAFPGRLVSNHDLIRPLIGPLLYMKPHCEELGEKEPVGIVISRGSRAEPAPLIQAFVWGTAPELAPVPQDTKAA